VTLEVRNVKFPIRAGARPKYWYGGRRAATIFLNNLSVFFPEGEAFFIRSVRAFQDRVQDPALREAVRAFCAQEGIHTREHLRYNEMLAAQGYRVAALERRVARTLARAGRIVPPRMQLAATVALEHFTATMGHVILDEPRALCGADPVMAALWRWHAAEEYEHKAVAFDVFRAAGGTYAERAATMLAVTAIFWAKVLEHQVAFMRDDGIALDPREWADLLYGLFVETRVAQHLARHYLDFFRPSFHPSHMERLEPVRRWKHEFETSSLYDASRRAANSRGGEAAASSDPENLVAIVGAGFSGLGMAIRLRQSGLGSFTLFEKGNDVGGTWRENRYPGCACDVPAHVYSFSFEPNPSWTRSLAPQEEIERYLRRCAEKHELAPRIRFGAEVVQAAWDEARSVWRLRTKGGEETSARFLVLGTGALHRPAVPRITGAERFLGKAFHSAAWDHGYDLRGKRVAVIGTGASAIQIVPKIAPEVAQLFVFQRTPPWILPNPDRPTSAWERRLFEALPLAQRLKRWLGYLALEARVLAFAFEPRLMHVAAAIARRHLRRQVADPELRRRLTPEYLPGCKRILLSNDYYPALSRENVRLVTAGISEITERGVVTADGRLHEVDAIIYATGFQVTEPPPRGTIIGREGKDLAACWRARIEAYLGTSVVGFPNLFLLMGPNTGLGHNSMVFMIESQIEHVLACMRAALRRGAGAVEVRPEAQAEFNAWLGPRLARGVWGTGCRSWYLDPSGHNPTVWPGSTLEFWWKTRRPVEPAYAFSSPVPASRG
jgi:cation diffusion facilitator CzcD-associated flavoprotein CzcO/predicted metal-dependent hydrolase